MTLACDNRAEWILVEENGVSTRTCTQHLREMVGSYITQIVQYAGDSPCCYFVPEPEDLNTLTCPHCKDRMVRAHWCIEEDWRVVWVCGCKPNPDVLEAIEALQKKTGECIIAMFGT